MKGVQGFALSMKKFAASVVVALAALPLSAFACDGGVDCSAIQPAPQPAPPPTALETLSNTLADNSGLIAGLMVGGAVIGYVISRRPKGLQPKGGAVIATSA